MWGNSSTMISSHFFLRQCRFGVENYSKSDAFKNFNNKCTIEDKNEQSTWLVNHSV